MANKLDWWGLRALEGAHTGPQREWQRQRSAPPFPRMAPPLPLWSIRAIGPIRAIVGIGTIGPVTVVRIRRGLAIHGRATHGGRVIATLGGRGHVKILTAVAVVRIRRGGAIHGRAAHEAIRERTGMTVGGNLTTTERSRSRFLFLCKLPHNSKVSFRSPGGGCFSPRWRFSLIFSF